MNYQKNEKGIISIVTILTIGLFSFGIATISLTGALKELEKNINNKNGERAFYTAEAAAREGVYQYINGNSNNGDNGDIPSLNQISNNSFEISGFPRKIVATAKSDKDYFRKIIYEMNVTSGEAFNHAIFSASELDLGGSSLINGSVFTNENIDFTNEGNKIIINGDAYYLTSITDTKKINPDYEVVKVDTSVPVPIINMDINNPYMTKAKIDGTYFDPTIIIGTDKKGKDITQSAADYIKAIAPTDPKTYTIYVAPSAGAFNLQSNTTVFKGNITIDNGNIPDFYQTNIINGGTYTAGPGQIAIIVRGNLDIRGGATINGIVYVYGTTTFTGNSTINGSLISLGDVTTGTGSVEINYDATYIGDLQDLIGLDPVSAAPPTISNWSEE